MVLKAARSGYFCFFAFVLPLIISLGSRAFASDHPLIDDPQDPYYGAEFPRTPKGAEFQRAPEYRDVSQTPCPTPDPTYYPGCPLIPGELLKALQGKGPAKERHGRGRAKWLYERAREGAIFVVAPFYVCQAAGQVIWDLSSLTWVVTRLTYRLVSPVFKMFLPWNICKAALGCCWRCTKDMLDEPI